ncbi:hypothetical protein ACSQ67_004412 [Phaseolus vulgaris]
MEAVNVFSVGKLHIPTASEIPTSYRKSLFLSNHVNSPISLLLRSSSKSKLFTALSPPPLTESSNQPEAEPELEGQAEKFDWYSQWYPLMPICDLDKRKPHGKRVLGIDVVVWWDRNEGAWQVHDDACPHRLAPLSEGRIDQWGRLQCVYHGWCFNGKGECKFIPQAPPDGPPNDILWFWPNSDPQYKDIITRKRPPHMPEIDDPSFTKLMGNRDIPYGYDVLIENLMDPAHVPYAHYGLMRTAEPKDQGWSKGKFMPPCIFYVYSPDQPAPSGETQKPSAQKKMSLVFICVPVSPGKSRLIWCFPRNFGLWMDKIVPRWIFHVGQNLILDSDLYLLHVEEHKIMDIGPNNWQKACFVPTKSDALVIGYRKWLKKYAGGQVDWRGKYSGALPSTPPREQLMDRYWSHVVNCKSCNSAYKSLNVAEVMLQIISVVSIGIVATMKQGTMSVATRNSMVVLAVLSFALSRWLAHFIYRNFRYHDYDHAFR